MLGADLLDVLDHRGGADLPAVEELEEHLDALPGGLRRLCQPAVQLVAAEVGDGVDVAVGLAGLVLDLARGQALFFQPLEDRVDVPVALAPEVAEALGVDALDVVPGQGP